MGVGVLTSRRQANMEMALADARASGGDCCNKPPSAPQGGVTGSRPATGTTPNVPYPRQSQLHPRTPQGQIARYTGNTPCGADSSQNVNQQGHTGNPADMQPALKNLIANPVSPYDENPLELPSGQRQCARGNCNPNQAASSTSSADAAYQQGYRDGVKGFNAGEECCPDDRAITYPANVQSDPNAREQYFQGYTDALNEGGTSNPAPGQEFTYNPTGTSNADAFNAPVGRKSRRLNLERFNNRGNLRRGVNRRGAAGY